MPGKCEFKRFGGDWVLQKKCLSTKGPCPAIPGGSETEGVSEADMHAASFLQSLRLYLGSTFSIAADDVLKLPCEDSASSGSYHRGNQTLLTFNKTSRTGGKISGILEVTILALPAPPAGGGGGE